MCSNSEVPVYKQVFKEFKENHSAEYAEFHTIVENAVAPLMQAHTEFDTHSLGREVLPNVGEEIQRIIRNIWESKGEKTGREVASVFGGIVVRIVNPGSNGWKREIIETDAKDKDGKSVKASRYSWNSNVST